MSVVLNFELWAKESCKRNVFRVEVELSELWKVGRRVMRHVFRAVAK